MDLHMDECPAPDSPADGIDSTVPASLEPIKGVYTKDVTIDSEIKVWARIYVPVSPDPHKYAGGNSTTDDERQLPVILYYHGGGFRRFAANALFYEPLCRRIARVCQAVVVSTNYRQGRDFRCPIPYDDSYKAFEWLRSLDSKAHLPAGADVSQCFIMGDSAGGNIAHFLGCRIAEVADISPVQIRGIVELQPLFGGEDLTPAEAADPQRNPQSPMLTLAILHDTWADFFPGPEHDRDHPNANVFGPNSSDISGLNLPPILVITGSEDVLIDRQVSYVRKLQSMGKDVTWLNYDGADHAFYCELDNQARAGAREAMENVSKFIRAHALKKEPRL